MIISYYRYFLNIIKKQSFEQQLIHMNYRQSQQPISFIKKSYVFQTELQKLIEDQKSYEKKQLNKISESNKKLNHLQQKMKRLFNKEKQKYSENRYKQKLYQQKKYQNDQDDLLITNSDQTPLQSNTQKVHKIQTHLPTHKKSKSSSSLRIIKKNKLIPQNKVEQKQKNDDKKVKYYQQNEKANYKQTQQQNEIKMIQSLYQRTTLLKNDQIQDLQRQIQRLEKLKLKQYQLNQQLEKQLYTIFKTKSKSNISIKNSSVQQSFNSRQDKQITQQLNRMKNYQQTQGLNKLLKEHQQIYMSLQEKRNQLKIDNKQLNFQIHLMQRQLKIAKNNRLNSLNQQKKQGQQQEAHQSSSKHKTLRNKQKVLNPINSLASLHTKHHSSTLKKKYSFIIPTPNKQNRHNNANCQLNNQSSNKFILKAMISQLDKLKSIVNKQISKEIGRSNRKVVQSYYNRKLSISNNQKSSHKKIVNQLR